MRDTAFKHALSILPIGTEVGIEGPMGSFTLHSNASKPAVFLAGGIGIAPFLSMLSYAAEERLRHSTLLFYANRYLEDAVFIDALRKLEKSNSSFRFVPTLTRMPNNNGVWARVGGDTSRRAIFIGLSVWAGKRAASLTSVGQRPKYAN